MNGVAGGIGGGLGSSVEKPSVAEVTLGNKIERHKTYHDSGGFLVKKDYEEVLRSARKIFKTEKVGVLGSEAAEITSMAKMAKIDFLTERDPRLIVYKALKSMLTENKLTGSYTGRQMNRNEVLFAEALKILGEEDQAQSLTDHYSHIH